MQASTSRLGVVLIFLCLGAVPAMPDDGKPATVNGELKRVCSFDKNGGTEKWFIVGIEEGQGAAEQTYSVDFGKDTPRHLTTGAHVTARGRLNGSALSVSSGSDESSLSVKS